MFEPHGAFVVLLARLWQQEADATLRKARALKAQRSEEYQKAHTSTSRSQEEPSSVANKQLEKKRRLAEEALQRVGGGRNYSRSALRIFPWFLRILTVWLSTTESPDGVTRLDKNSLCSLPPTRRRRPRSNTRAALLTPASGRWTWPTPRAPSSRRSARWSSSVTSRSRRWVSSDVTNQTTQ